MQHVQVIPPKISEKIRWRHISVFHFTPVHVSYLPSFRRSINQLLPMVAVGLKFGDWVAGHDTHLGGGGQTHRWGQGSGRGSCAYTIYHPFHVISRKQAHWAQICEAGSLPLKCSARQVYVATAHVHSTPFLYLGKYLVDWDLTRYIGLLTWVKKNIYHISSSEVEHVIWQCIASALKNK